MIYLEAWLNLIWNYNDNKMDTRCMSDFDYFLDYNIK